MEQKTLAMLRKEKNMTQRELAEILNISHGAVGMYEVGLRTPSLEMARKIAGVFNISTDQLFFAKIDNKMKAC